ncbi:fatty acid desaturase-domain-containing protein [Xylariaceae sp. FL0662B]|nr:fatty acid desaturase-domain-containing protein [Xylariaceae sp. FL0662B]
MASQITKVLPGTDLRNRIENKPDTIPNPKHIDLDGNVFDLPDFTMKQIYDAIPAHCFQPSIPRSLAYVVRDYLYLGGLMYATYTYVPMLPSAYLRAVCYGLYTVLAGMIMTGIWILAHECGHGAFSKNKTLNDTMGFFLHSSLLVPYYSWKITHSHHHKATGDLQRDTVFVPHSREYWVKHNLGHDADPMTVESVSEDAPIVTLWHCMLHQLFGWPLYMLDNLSGQKGQHGFPYYSHYWFRKDSAIYKASELRSIFLSDVGVVLMTSLLYYLGVKPLGWWTTLVFYGVPYIWLNHWIVLITFLQHTDGRLPHFTHSQWTFARGAAATIDRDFGFIDTHLFHHIVGTHVVHHLVSSIPFYHAQEATEAVKKVMGKHYHADRDTPLLSAFWRNQRDCQFVEESPGMEGSGVFMFRNLHGRGVKPRNLGEVLVGGLQQQRQQKEPP